jgi:hypothetical protein
MHLIKAKPSLFLVVMVICGALFANPMGGAQSSNNQELVAALSLPTETLCMNATNHDIDAAIAFTNRSGKDIFLQTSGGRSLTVLGLFGTRTLKPLLSSWMSMSDQTAKGSSPDTVLHPGETINYPFHLRLSAEVLSEPGFYKVQASYDAVSHESSGAGNPVDLSGRTNWVILQVRECSNQ